MSQNRLALNAQEYVRKAVASSSDDEIALDCLAQWASIKVGKDSGDGTEENFPIIKENLCTRFDISEDMATEYTARLREYVAQFLLSGAEIDLVRENMMEALKGEPGKKLRQVMLKKFNKSNQETKRLTHLIFYLLGRGLDPKSFEMSLDVLQAFHVAAFERTFSLDRQEELVEIGILNRTLYTSSALANQYIHTVNPLFPTESMELDPESLKIVIDSKHYAMHLFEKKNYTQLSCLDEVSRESFGVKKYDAPPQDFNLEKKITGRYESYLAISPFVLEEIRDEIHTIKYQRLEEYKLRLDSSLLALVKESWPEGKLDLSEPKAGQALWRVDNEVDPKLYVYLTPWLTENDLVEIATLMEIPKVSTLVCVVLNQNPESAKLALKDRVTEHGQIMLVYPLKNQKEVQAEDLSGVKTTFSSAVSKSLVRAMNLTIRLEDLVKAERAPASSEVGVGAQYGTKPEGAKFLIGMQDSIGVYWTPTKERNWNFGIFGEQGSGKTQVIKKILSQMRTSAISYMVLDSFGEYVSKDPSNQEFGSVVGINEISVNPLEVTKGSSPRVQGYRLVEALKSIYGLTEPQTIHLRNAVRKSYDAKGVFEDEPRSWANPSPTLQDVQPDLRPQDKHAKEVKELLQKIGPALESPLFSRTKTYIPFEKLVAGPIVLNLSGLQTNEFKALASEFILDKIPFFIENYTIEPKFFVAVDGAPNMFQKDSNSMRLLTESRRKGLGLIYPFRDPSNLPEIAFNKTATIVSFRQSDSKIAKVTAEHLDIEDKVLKKSLPDKFSAVAKFSSRTDVAKFAATPYFQK